jgi:hypothetical protein
MKKLSNGSWLGIVTAIVLLAGIAIYTGRVMMINRKMVGWQTYNLSSGFEFRYPPGMTFETGEDDTAILMDGAVVGELYREYRGGLSVGEVAKWYRTHWLLSEKNGQIDGRDWLQLSISYPTVVGKKTIYNFIEDSDEWLLVVSFTNINDDFPYNQIVSTFNYR